MVHRVLAAGVVALLLMCVPAHLAAMEEKDARASELGSEMGWLSGVWSDIAAWFAEKVVPPPPAGSGEAEADGGCWIDPDGCPHGG